MKKDNMPQYIAIEGPIGVGKTSLARKIALEFGHDLCLEDPDDNPFLQSFYENSQKYAFATQIHFVMQRSQQINTYFSDDLIERKIVSDFIFQKEDLFAELNLSFDELKIFKEVKSKFYDSYPKPDLLIYLQASPRRVYERVKKRGRAYEEQISLEYLEKICEKYSEFFFNYSESPLLVLNVDDVDFVTSQIDYEKVRDCLQRDIVGKEFVNLSPSFF
jgi:Deoxynucleoside kinases|tara:strand:+ start:200 stop:853 length:654 start_codon:yes stop_codon:yes gene_type:complete